MNKNLAILLVLSALVACATAAIESLTVGDVTYRNVTLKKEFPVSFFVQHDGGMAFIKRADLSEAQIAELLGAPEQEASAPAQDATPEPAEKQDANPVSTEPEATTPSEPGETSPAENPAPAEEKGPKASENATAAEPSKLIGQEAPEIRLMDRQLKETSLSALRGKVVLINFNLPTGCEETCLPDFGLLSEMQAKYEGKPVELVSVLVDFDSSNWKKTLEDHKITWNTALPGNAAEQAPAADEKAPEVPLADPYYFVSVMKDYDVSTLAANVIVDQGGKVTGVFGPLVSEREKVEKAIADALGN